ncbi:PadR family transcriptional regulator [Arthrobacter cupressi]|uniref:Virulence activator alpha C-term n=1 Tax=Arthrobacter cupressi TaxID=1045773 RepID=A0A1G8XJ68_9MICC|nr:PadR family transcriptional regulator [Arthrobacter cupressi]NYD78750.1 DNA-binding PadR family transcriptional regulator [Arthrobacter cupressi]SDJ90536.1 Virulence activator alpha C-term [Arthrobacter cupressi]
MAIRHGILALLQDKARYGYELRAEFEARTGGVWPLNIGQVYSTLDRLERDGLVVREGSDGEGHVVYSLSPAGRDDVEQWFSTAANRSSTPRNELAIKLSLAATLPGSELPTIIQEQRDASLAKLQELNQLRKDVPAGPRAEDIARIMVLDSLVFQLEAELRWLDLCEARLVHTGQIAAVLPEV